MFVCLSILWSTTLPSSTTRKKHVWVIPFPKVGIGTNGINSFHFLCVLWIPPLIELRHRQWQIAIAQCVLQQQKRHVQKYPLDRHACAVQQRSRHNRPRTITRQTHRAFRRQFSRHRLQIFHPADPIPAGASLLPAKPLVSAAPTSHAIPAVTGWRETPTSIRVAIAAEPRGSSESAHRRRNSRSCSPTPARPRGNPGVSPQSREFPVRREKRPTEAPSPAGPPAGRPQAADDGARVLRHLRQCRKNRCRRARKASEV